MRYAAGPGGSHCRRHRSREDKAWRGRADRVADHGISRDVTPHHTETLGLGSFDDVDAIHDAIALGDAGAAGSVKTDGMNLVKVGEGPEFRRQITDMPDRGDIAIHRVKRFKGDDLGTELPGLAQQRFEMVEIVVPEDTLLSEIG